MIPVVVVCCVSACSSGDDTTPTTSTTVTTMVPTTVTVAPDLTAAYFDGLAAIGGTGMTPPEVAALPASDAALYFEYQTIARGLLGVTGTRSVVEYADGVQLCEAADECATFSDVVTDPGSGRVSDFSIDGVALAGRIVGDGALADRDGMVAHVVSAYVANSSDVFVVIGIDNTTDVALEVFAFAAVLEPTAAGLGVEATGAWGGERIEAGATARQLVRFPSADLGGRVRLSGLRSDGLDVTFDLSVPTPAG